MSLSELFSIPTYPEPYYDESVTINEVPYVFRFRYNTREACIYLSLLDVGRQTLVDGIKVVPIIDLLEQYRYNPSVPQVALFAMPQTPDDSPPAYDELGQDARVKLYYVTL